MLGLERCCGLLAVGGFAGLVGASNYSVAMAAAVQDWDKDALDNDYTKTCAAGCASCSPRDPVWMRRTGIRCGTRLS